MCDDGNLCVSHNNLITMNFLLRKTAFSVFLVLTESVKT